MNDEYYMDDCYEMRDLLFTIAKWDDNRYYTFGTKRYIAFMTRMNLPP